MARERATALASRIEALADEKAIEMIIKLIELMESRQRLGELPSIAPLTTKKH